MVHGRHRKGSPYDRKTVRRVLSPLKTSAEINHSVILRPFVSSVSNAYRSVGQFCRRHSDFLRTLSFPLPFCLYPVPWEGGGERGSGRGEVAGGGRGGGGRRNGGTWCRRPRNCNWVGRGPSRPVEGRDKAQSILRRQILKSFLRLLVSSWLDFKTEEQSNRPTTDRSINDTQSQKRRHVNLIITDETSHHQHF